MDFILGFDCEDPVLCTSPSESIIMTFIGDVGTSNGFNLVRGEKFSKGILVLSIGVGDKEVTNNFWLVQRLRP